MLDYDYFSFPFTERKDKEGYNLRLWQCSVQEQQCFSNQHVTKETVAKPCLLLHYISYQTVANCSNRGKLCREKFRSKTWHFATIFDTRSFCYARIRMFYVRSISWFLLRIATKSWSYPRKFTWL